MVFDEYELKYLLQKSAYEKLLEIFSSGDTVTFEQVVGSAVTLKPADGDGDGEGDAWSPTGAEKSSARTSVSTPESAEGRRRFNPEDLDF